MTQEEHRRMNTLLGVLALIMTILVAYVGLARDKELETGMQQCEQMLFENLFNSDYPLAVKKEK